MISVDALWRLMLQMRQSQAKGGLALDDDGRSLSLKPTDPEVLFSRPTSESAWQIGSALEAPLRDFASLYLPLMSSGPSRPLVVAHLGQSIDSAIATRRGESSGLTGAANHRHMHRMRALSDAIIVGAGTVAADDPQLTTRQVEGANPVRVIIDPDLRLSGEEGVFTDGAAETLCVCRRGAVADASRFLGSEQRALLPIDERQGQLDLADLIPRLAERGLHTLFIEGGGVTVSRCIQAGVVDRLQIAIAPVVVGQGRPALTGPPAADMASVWRPQGQLYRMGNDVLWDFDLNAKPFGSNPTGIASDAVSAAELPERLR